MPHELSYLSTPDSLPKVGNAERAARGLEHWREAADRLDDPDLARFAHDLAADPFGKALLEAVFSNSPFLTQCILNDILALREFLTNGPEALLHGALREALEDAAFSRERETCMAILRRARRRAALAVALADLAGGWSLVQVTEALSDFADAAVDAALSHLLLRARERGDIELADETRPTKDCGLVVLAMGKLGARELNYSSDIDLIVIHDLDRARYRGRKDVHDFFVRITRDMVRILEDRTRDGYVARVDLRLRPDPSAMPVAISISAAETYYESLGQNWERAAMIKARACAGDLALGREFLSVLRPFVWRKHLDFWAIQDVHSIKRQIHANRGGSTVTVAGHDIKVGRGGIREIEFYAQTQQLIWGGRDPDLRAPRTVDALNALAGAGHVSREDADALIAAYTYLRRLEHRLQMVNDQQTQTLPEDEQSLGEIAAFMGHDDARAFSHELLQYLHTVEDRYAGLFEEAPSLSGSGNLVFTGGEADPETVKTLARLGFNDGERVFHIVANWHRGRYRAMRSRRTREILTELVPTLLEALGRTANPDAALAKFDEFVAGLPAGVQLFSMLYQNPRLLDLLAQIVGAAPALADHLGRKPGLLEAVLTPGFFEAVPDREALREDLEQLLQDARDFEDVLDIARRWTGDRKFQVGVHMLEAGHDIDETGRALSDIAEVVLACLWPRVLAEFAALHGELPPPGMAVVALGKLGGRELTISSDLDLVLLAETDPDAQQSDGRKPLEPGRYFTRLAQRFINAITAMTAEGRLYDVDMRLRPQGEGGQLVATLAGYRKYYESDAWVWEHMALTRARAVVGGAEFRGRIDDAVREILTRPREPGALLAAVHDMRQRIAKEHPARSDWHVKYIRGGLIDLEFLAQTLQLQYAHAHPGVLAQGTQDAFSALADEGILTPQRAEFLISATRLMRRVQGLLRLMAGSAFDEATAPEGLKAQLAAACGCADFEALRERVLATAEQVHHIFRELIEDPAAAAAPDENQGENSKESRT
ncbi:bifunctional [glutamine synthetase] adenylyltransferase/[glutamine synthetase]-adenylyl-L-tyrosine phosphorylase [Ferruginivarius sediminum]|uniref:Bifunctional glutamine synthetase adenylyltransferase/adenylyl-removing enzyme n=1 Tax=Ferruginivarius sediminum TaxID=2661937 RepID=A0A369TD86_9PROT|nr:bifunctional [glutamine synthetase] adenylyltransferase/[glutamine synthetase]-adenylyl-L-tyrosine phosphorylase [Ferruginivarius sediminum]RDD60886.1 bifunctional [glutamine synthetase] adenylyltransferase/[glutamine synthetase]-adenylyl-L-tyrosine phosphorylase [Ferruginivarius sediminum]